MIDVLITSKTRIKLLVKFFLNRDTRSYLRSLESEFGESTNAIRVELNRLEDAGLLLSSIEGNRKIYQANQSHPIFNDIQNLLMKFIGVDAIIERVLRRIGHLHSAYIIGDFARGIDNHIIELLLIGDDLDVDYTATLVAKAEKLIGRKISILILAKENVNQYLIQHPNLLIWQSVSDVIPDGID